MISFGVIALLLVVVLGCLTLGVPIAFSLGLAGVVTILAASGERFLVQLPLTLYRSLSDPIILAIPLYILMGEILYRGKVGQQLFGVANVWLRRVRGGTGVAAVAAFTFFAAIVGSSMASVLTIGKIAIPEMRALGYSKRLTYGLSAVGGALGILIPPSIPLIIYASLSNASPGQLFTAGIIPGLLLAGLLAVWAVVAAPSMVAKDERWSLGEAIRLTLGSLPDLALPVVVLGGIYLGVYTPTEAAAVGVVYAVLLTMVARRTVTLKDLPSILVGATRSSAMLLAIVIGALVLGSALTLIGLPQMLARSVTEANLSPWIVLLVMNLIWFVLGCFLEVISILLITVPVFYPVAMAVGFDPIWFGIILVINMELAVITPPVGMNLFALKTILPNERLEEIARAAVPSVSIVLLALALVWIFPPLALYLPGH